MFEVNVRITYLFHAMQTHYNQYVKDPSDPIVPLGESLAKIQCTIKGFTNSTVYNGKYPYKVR